MGVAPAKTITLTIGDPVVHQPDQMPPTNKPTPQRRQTHFLHAHETVLDILKRHNLPTDGSVRVKVPKGTDAPRSARFFPMDVEPYRYVADHSTLEIVSNPGEEPVAPLSGDQQKADQPEGSGSPDADNEEAD